MSELAREVALGKGPLDPNGRTTVWEFLGYPSEAAYDADNPSSDPSEADEEDIKSAMSHPDPAIRKFAREVLGIGAIATMNLRAQEREQRPIALKQRQGRAPRRRTHRTSAITRAGSNDDDPAPSDDEDDSHRGGASSQQVGRNRPRLVAISSPAAITVSDITSLAVCGMEPRFFRRFVIEQDIPHVKVHRRTIAKVADVLAAFDRLAGISSAPSAESEWSAEDTILRAIGGAR